MAYIWAGREWAKAAAHEAAHDGRLQEEDEVFFFQLEEIKQMMTGEWNVSDLSDIHATAAERKRQVEAWRELHTPPVLVGDRAAVHRRGAAGRIRLGDRAAASPARTTNRGL